MSRTLVGSVSSTRTTLFVAPYCTVASRLVSSMDRISPNTHGALRSLRTITLPRDAFGTSGAAATANGPAAGVTHRASAAAASLSCAACIVAELRGDGSNEMAMPHREMALASCDLALSRRDGAHAPCNGAHAP